ncbi:MAG: DUF3108 domain-containing protein [Desulfobacteraceae bacterium]|nr:MAG: DUF3108 domain-containing protein [Desulfobacteraceae bacterium]
MKKRSLRRTLHVWMIFVFFSMFIAANAHSRDLPFAPGEILEYALRWENVPAGSARLEIMPVKIINGEQVHHFVLTAESNAFVDIFYKVRDRIDAFADLSMSRSLLYQKKQREGRHHRDEIIEFNWQNGQAQYSNHGQKKEPIELMDGSFDPLSAFYFTRTLDLEIGHNMERPITDGRKNVIGRLRVTGRETITLLNGRTYDTYRVEPELNHVSGVFKEGINAKIQLWVTADEKRIPVRIQSKIRIGQFIGELITAEGLR